MKNLMLAICCLLLQGADYVLHILDSLAYSKNISRPLKNSVIGVHEEWAIQMVLALFLVSSC